MPAPDAIFAHLPGFALVLSRLSGLFIFAPLLSGQIVPRRFKAMIALAFALAVYPTIEHARTIPARIDLFDLGALMAGELLIGLSIGVLASIPLVAAQIAGVTMGQQMGLGLAQVYNPAADFEGEVLSQVLFFVALALYLLAGGLEALFGTLVSTFHRVPIGGIGLADAPLDLLTGMVASGFAVALRLSMPVLAILMLESLALGFIMKTVPSMNIMTVGFPVRIMLGMLMVLSSIVITLEVLMGEAGAGLDALKEWALSLG